MAIFTAIGIAVAAAATGATFATVGAALTAGAYAFAAIATVTAIGASYIASRIINGNPNKGGLAAGNQGGRIQLPPATNNKIPVVYGSAYVNGIITDAKLTTDDFKDNNIMYYCVVLSETVNDLDAAYTIGDIYWNDLRMVFQSSTNSHKALEGRKKVNSTTAEDFSDSFTIDGRSLVEIRVYRGNSNSANQIFPANNPVAAYNFWGSKDANGTDGTGWTPANQMEGLVFAIVKMRYNADKGFTGIPNLTFQVNNSISNPASVWKDYMTSKRYGAGISSNFIDDTALTDWLNYSNESITYTNLDGASTTQPRYRINGVIDTTRSVKENIDIILQNGACWLSYEVATGLWRPIVKRAATAGELSSALTFNDDNILSGIAISSTNLNDLYNGYEVEYFDRYNRDQRAYRQADISSLLRNPNEPDNRLRMGLELCNGNVQAELIAGMEVRQSRDDLVIEFTASHYGIQAQAGDVIYVENDLYGWTSPTFPGGKLFRVMRTKEIETEEGGLIANIQALEYNADVYTVETLQEFTTIANIGIIPRVSTGTDSANIRKPEDSRVSVVKVNDTDPVPTIELVVKIPEDGGPYDEIQVWSATAPIATPPNDNSYTLYQTHRPPPPEVIFDNGRTITVSSITSNVLTSVEHGLQDGDNLYYYDASTNGLTQNSGYWVINATTDTFQLTGSCNCPGSIITLTDGTGLSINLDTCHIIVISGLPANVTGQKYYFKVRVGVDGRHGDFTDPDDATVIDNTPTTPYNPYGGAGFNVTGAQEGETLYYDADTSVWKNTDIIKINDTTRATTLDGNLLVNDAITVNADGDPDYQYLYFKSGSDTQYLRYKTEGAHFDFSRALKIYDLYLGLNPFNYPGETQINMLSNGENGYLKWDGIRWSIEGSRTDITGDLRVLGNDIQSSTGATAITLSAADVAIAGDLTVTGNDIKSSTATAITFSGSNVSLAGELTVANDVRINGNDIKSSTGATAITLSGADVIVAGDIRINGNDIKSSSNDVAITLSGAGVRTAGTLTLGGNIIRNADETTIITFLSDSLRVATKLRIIGNEIQNSSGDTAIYLVANRAVEIAGDLTVGGNDIKSLGGTTAITLNGSNVTIAGNLTVNGTTTTVNSTIVTIDDPVFTLGGDTAPSVDDGKDRGIEFRWYDTSAKIGFFGFDRSTGKFTFIPDATNTNEVFSGTKGELDVSVDWSNILNKPDPTITLAGDLGGSVTLTDLTSATLTATIQPNSVALGTDTTGNYVATITGTTNQVIVSGSGTETAAVTLSLPQDIATTSNPTFNDLTLSGDIRINGNDIKDSDGTTRITFDAVNEETYIPTQLRTDYLNIDSVGFFNTSTLTTTTTAANQQLLSINKTLFRTVKATISITSGTEYQSVEILMLHDGTTAYFTTYADIKSGTNLATFSADISGTVFRLLVTPTNAVSTFKVVRHSVAV